MTAAELLAALATAPELAECANAWRPEVRLVGNVRADSIALVCRALLALHAENERMRPVYESACRLADRWWLPVCAETEALIAGIKAAREKGGT